MSQPEHNVQNRIRLAIPPHEACLFRNNVGTAWTGKTERVSRAGTVTVQPGDVVIRKARPFHAGLCEGSGDLIGWREITITTEMVGKKVAVFSSVEVKTLTGKPSTAQKHWHNRVLQAGGLSVIARSAEDAKRGLRIV